MENYPLKKGGDACLQRLQVYKNEQIMKTKFMKKFKVILTIKLLLTNITNQIVSQNKGLFLGQGKSMGL